MPNNNILITGSSGQLGKQFKLLDYKSNNKYFYMNRLNLDITKFDDLYKYIEHNDITASWLHYLRTFIISCLLIQVTSKPHTPLIPGPEVPRAWQRRSNEPRRHLNVEHCTAGWKSVVPGSEHIAPVRLQASEDASAV